VEALRETTTFFALRFRFTSPELSDDDDDEESLSELLSLSDELSSSELELSSPMTKFLTDIPTDDNTLLPLLPGDLASSSSSFPDFLKEDITFEMAGRLLRLLPVFIPSSSTLVSVLDFLKEDTIFVIVLLLLLVGVPSSLLSLRDASADSFFETILTTFFCFG